MTCISTEKCIFWTRNKAVDEWTLTSSTAVSGYSANRLRETARKLTWRSTAGGSQWVDGVNVTSGVQMNKPAKRGVAIINHNLDTLAPVTGTFRIQLWDIAGNIKFDQVCNAINYTIFSSYFEEIIDTIRPYKNFVVYLPDSIPNFVMGHWRITMIDSTKSYYEIGRVIIGEQFQPKDNFYNGMAHVSGVDDTRTDKTYGGDKTSDNRPKHRGMNLSPPATIKNLEDITDWMRLIHVIGKREPIFVDPYPKTGLPPDFAVGEEAAATKNLVNQMYGTNANGMSIAWNSENTAVTSGGIFIEEQA